MDHCANCKIMLEEIDSILENYNELNERERSWKKLLQKLRFGSLEMKRLGDIRSKIGAHNSAIMMCLQVMSIGSNGKIEVATGSMQVQLTHLAQKSDVQSVCNKVEGMEYILRSVAETTKDILKSQQPEGSVWTAYGNDDTAIYRDLRRELRNRGFLDEHLRHYGVQKIIETLLKDLNNGAFDDIVGGDESIKVDDIVTTNLKQIPQPGAVDPGGKRDTCRDLRLEAVLDGTTLQNAHPDVVISNENPTNFQQSPALGALRNNVSAEATQRNLQNQNAGFYRLNDTGLSRSFLPHQNFRDSLGRPAAPTHSPSQFYLGSASFTNVLSQSERRYANQSTGVSILQRQDSSNISHQALQEGFAQGQRPWMTNAPGRLGNFSRPGVAEVPKSNITRQFHQNHGYQTLDNIRTSHGNTAGDYKKPQEVQDQSSQAFRNDWNISKRYSNLQQLRPNAPRIHPSLSQPPVQFPAQSQNLQQPNCTTDTSRWFQTRETTFPNTGEPKIYKESPDNYLFPQQGSHWGISPVPKARHNTNFAPRNYQNLNPDSGQSASTQAISWQNYRRTPDAATLSQPRNVFEFQAMQNISKGAANGYSYYFGNHSTARKAKFPLNPNNASYFEKPSVPRQESWPPNLNNNSPSKFQDSKLDVSTIQQIPFGQNNIDWRPQQQFNASQLPRRPFQHLQNNHHLATQYSMPAVQNNRNFEFVTNRAQTTLNENENFKLAPPPLNFPAPHESLRRRSKSMGNIYGISNGDQGTSAYIERPNFTSYNIAPQQPNLDHNEALLSQGSGDNVDEFSEEISLPERRKSRRRKKRLQIKAEDMGYAGSDSSTDYEQSVYGTATAEPRRRDRFLNWFLGNSSVGNYRGGSLLRRARSYDSF